MLCVLFCFVDVTFIQSTILCFAPLNCPGDGNGDGDGDVLISSPRLSSSPAACAWNRRYEQFLAIFQSLRESRFEDEMMEETDFKTATNEVTKTTTFTDGEIDEHLKRLVSEGKIVQSDGCIFLV
mmetsp:Transcript_6184/g.16820  ORF Transcript_6184/g.16820 Transcript_6184/m.16820 type:complete len:125 (+) Transcript_6184:112-486(+)